MRAEIKRASPHCDFLSSPTSVQEWLAEMNLSCHEEAFVRAGFTTGARSSKRAASTLLTDLANLTDARLRAMGIPIGHRKRILIGGSKIDVASSIPETPESAYSGPDGWPGRLWSIPEAVRDLEKSSTSASPPSTKTSGRTDGGAELHGAEQATRRGPLTIFLLGVRVQFQRHVRTAVLLALVLACYLLLTRESLDHGHSRAAALIAPFCVLNFIGLSSSVALHARAVLVLSVLIPVHDVTTIARRLANGGGADDLVLMIGAAAAVTTVFWTAYRTWNRLDEASFIFRAWRHLNGICALILAITIPILYSLPTIAPELCAARETVYLPHDASLLGSVAFTIIAAAACAGATEANRQRLLRLWQVPLSVLSASDLGLLHRLQHDLSPSPTAADTSHDSSSAAAVESDGKSSCWRRAESYVRFVE